MTKGKFIVFEGGEGCGKSTQAKLLFDVLNEKGVPTLYTREPGGTDGAEAIRRLLVEGESGRWDKITETLLFMAARRDHVERLIRPALERGEWVICDRFFLSTLAYQGYGHGVQLEVLKGLHKLTLGEFAPDFTMVFDIDWETGVEAAKAREVANVHKDSEDRFERMSSLFHKNVRRGFLTLAKEMGGNVQVINASGTILGVHMKVIDLCNEALGLHLKPGKKDV